MMIFVNELYRVEKIYYPYLVEFIKMFDCICPFVGEEIWNMMGHKSLITYEKWPTFDPSKLVLSTITIAVQVNGKLRDTIEISKDEEDEKMDEKYTSQVISPIIAEGDNVGAIIILSKETESILGEIEIKVAETAAAFMGKQME